MDFPDLGHLPPWAAVLFVVCVAFVFVATRTGWLDGLRKPPVSQATVAAVIVDPAALNAATAAVDRLTAQQARNEAAHAEVATQLGKLCDLIGQVVLDQREERNAEKEEAIRREGYEAGLADRRPLRRPRNSKA